MNYVTELAPYLEAVETNYQKLLRLLSPYDVAGQTKLRIGPAHDGGYVMLDPGRDQPGHTPFFVLGILLGFGDGKPGI